MGLWVATGTSVAEDPPTSAGWSKRVVRHVVGEGVGSTGSTGATGPPAFPIPGSISIAPGDSWSAKSAAAPNNQVFSCLAGTHIRPSFTPKPGQQFIGAPGTPGTYGPTGLTSKCDGQGVATRLMIGNSINDVTVKNLEVYGYNPGGQRHAIEATNNFGQHCSGWLVDNCDVHDNLYGGIEIGDTSVVSNCHVHHNKYQGVKSSFSTGAQFINIELDHNHWAAGAPLPVSDDPFGEATGSKCTDTTSLLWDGCFVHHNAGPGLWTDINNFQTTYRNNLVEDNRWAGIMHEISYDASIHDNTLNRNGDGLGGWIWNAGVLISASGGVGSGIIEVYNNTMTGNTHGISLAQQNRGSGSMGAYVIRNVRCHDNHITGSDYTGAVQDIGSNAIFAAGLNTWVHDDYHSCVRFAWNNGDANFAQWQAVPQDATGSFV